MLHRIVLAAVVLPGIMVSSLALQGEDRTAPTDAPVQRMLVLRNSRIIEGRIEQVDGGYVVDFGNGQIRVNSTEVELVCDGLEDGYRRKRAAIRPGNLHHHLALAQWCLRHDLLEHAAAELADAVAVEPDHPMIGILQHRLDMARKPPPPVRVDVARQATSGPSNDEVDGMVRNLPSGAVETFTQSVQPVLMNHCATGGCHGPQSADALRLFRVSLGKRASRRVTQRNLYSVLSLVDRNTPLDSRLLTVPIAPHGDVEHAIFNGHQAAQYRRLIDWVVQLSGQSAPQELSEGAQKARPLSVGGKKQDGSPLDTL